MSHYIFVINFQVYANNVGGWIKLSHLTFYTINPLERACGTASKLQLKKIKSS